jgi:hypothetical protein
MPNALVYVAGVILVGWGAMHIAPTRAVADSFDASPQNRRIFVMEWVAEGIAHAGLGMLVVLVAAFATDGDTVYPVVAGILVTLAVLTALTGSRTPVVWFKVCPVVLTSAAAFLVTASLL